MNDDEIKNEDIDELLTKLDSEAQSSGYNLNPDISFTRSLVKGLLINQKRYGYQSCPCRLASGKKESDLDIICPCDYRDPDLDQFGACYCALYVDEDIKKGRKQVNPIPDRRFDKDRDEQDLRENWGKIKFKFPIWRCKVCGYLCARENPPALCPICKAERERFEIFVDIGK